MAGIPIVIPPGSGAWQPANNNTQANSDSPSPAGWTSKTFLVAALLFIFLLMLANYFPKYVIGFMVLLLVGVILTHSDIITKFFAI